jgi:uncharacterized metal-binding protein
MDTSSLVFTLAQVVKPFELWAARQLTGLPYELFAPDEKPSIVWLVGTMMHSVLSLILLALFVLAVRWRFRRE